jgi:glucose-1-phosphate cytidylyltransferase
MKFSEKPLAGEGWINGGFFVFEPEVFRYFINGDKEVLEGYPIETLTAEKELSAYRHDGFWQCMDTLREKNQLDDMWQSGKAPWKIW